MTKLKIGVIGAGSMGKNHVRVYDRLKHDVELIGIYDANFQHSRKIAKDFNTVPYENMEELLAACDAVSIAVPTSLHYDIAMKALNLNTHVLIEKPITVLPEEAKEIIDLANKEGLIVQVGHIERFNPAVRTLAEILKDHRVIGVDIQRMSPYDGRISDADVIQDLMIHDIDIVLSLFPSKIKDVQSFGNIIFSKDKIDYAVASLQLENDMIINLTASRVTQEKIRRIGITTETAYIQLDYMEKKVLLSRKTNMIEGKDKTMTYRQENIVEKVYVPNEEPLLVELQAFIDSIKNNSVPVVTAYDGLKAVEMSERIRKQVYDRLNTSLLLTR
ncbi:Gfo/Idh/MocA family protein [Tepidibacillus fermentans]|uniref:Putative dehydrogenase n=1 Tax=Tepidibacillus fermentans TaxID=1281767 RepID=A0A4R3KJD0_9BACI|nr:Gfo/Idh/MocA family oxidoreductase [Tepidibacillus fermentans]TCS83375.1 putative dehydrogenase [Tepidibacillus fermentans]